MEEKTKIKARRIPGSSLALSDPWAADAFCKEMIVERKTKKLTPAKRPAPDLEALIRESLPKHPRYMPAVRAAKEYYQLLAKPLSYLDPQ